MSFQDNYMCYTGLRMPDGTPYTDPFGNIMFNGDKHVEEENVLLNQRSYLMYFWRLLDLAMSVFEWKNLPEGVDERMMEMWLLINGMCVFFYDEDLKTSELADHQAPEGFAVLEVLAQGMWDMYHYPTERSAYSVNGMNIPLTRENSVIIFNDYLRIPMIPSLQLYAQRLAEIDRTIDLNVMNQKTPKVIKCQDKDRLSWKNMMMQAQGNVYWILADKSMNLDNIEVLDTSAPYVANELQILKHQIWNEVLTFLGVENVTTEKKERLVSNEVMSNMGDVEAQRFVRLNARKQACKEINKIFADRLEDEVDCDFRSGIYIKADGYGAQNIATTGMRDMNVITQGGEGYGSSASDRGVLTQIRQLLGI